MDTVIKIIQYYNFNVIRTYPCLRSTEVFRFCSKSQNYAYLKSHSKACRLLDLVKFGFVFSTSDRNGTKIEGRHRWLDY